MTLATPPARQTARHTRQGVETARRIFSETTLAAAGTIEFTSMLNVAATRVANGPAPEAFKAAFADTLRDLRTAE